MSFKFFGLQYHLTDEWSLGMVLQTPSLHLSGDGDFQASSVSGGGESSMLLADNLEARNEQPFKLVLGLYRGRAREYGIGLDVTLRGANDYKRLEGRYIDGSRGFVEYKNESVIDLNVGGEYYWRGRFPLRAGFFTSHSSAPETDVRNLDYPGKIDLYGLTMSAGSESENMSINVGLNYVFGKGDAYGWDALGNPRVVDTTEKSLYMFIASAYMF